MNDVGAFLAGVRTAESPLLDADLVDLRARREALAALPDALAITGLERLAQKRLLASNTLMRRSEDERLAWDAANEWLAAQLETPWTVTELAEMNRRLGSTGTYREEPVFSGFDEYLGPARIDAALARLAEYMATTTHDVLRVAATMYIHVVTIHPFPNANGRTARLAADRVLLADGALPLCFLSPIRSHVAQLETSPMRRDPTRALRIVFGGMTESYTTVLPV